MRPLIAIISILIAQGLAAQDLPLFKVITCSGGVTIGGVAPTPGMNVANGDQQVNIPLDGYLGVITSSGYPMTITWSTTTSQIKFDPSVSNTGAVLRNEPAGVEVYGAALNTNKAFTVSDSIFIHWKSSYPDVGQESVIRFINMYEETLHEITTDKNFLVVSVADMFVQSPKGVIFDIAMKRTDFTQPSPPASEKSKKKKRFAGATGDARRSDMIVIRKLGEKELQRINFDLARLPQSDRLFFEAALYLLDGATYESTMCIYRIMRSNMSTSDPILDKFYKVLFQEYDLKAVSLN